MLCRVCSHVEEELLAQVERCQQPVPGDMGEPGWERGVTGGCHPLCVLWHADSVLPQGVFAPLGSCHYSHLAGFGAPALS